MSMCCPLSFLPSESHSLAESTKVDIGNSTPSCSRYDGFDSPKTKVEAVRIAAAGTEAAGAELAIEPDLVAAGVVWTTGACAADELLPEPPPLEPIGSARELAAPAFSTN